MSHFAKVENGYVVNVVVAEQDWVDEQEGLWIQTSYNLAGGVYTDPETREQSVYTEGPRSRCNYASIGMIYDSKRDKFYKPDSKPFDSWTFNYDTGSWEAPVPYPRDGVVKIWNEETQSWEPEE
jgi:hypothetical protein